MYRCKKCGSVFFKAEQVCSVRHDVVVNGDNEFIADIDGTFDPFETERPEGPYECIKCGAKYEDLCELKDADTPKDYTGMAHRVWKDAVKMRAEDLDADELEAAYRKRELEYRTEDARECCRKLYGKTFTDSDLAAIAEIFLDKYNITLPEDIQMQDAVKFFAGLQSKKEA